LGMLVWQAMPSGGQGTPSPFFVVALANIGSRI